MCGIIGYVGDSNKSLSVVMDGLKSLEYRGYDSSGVVVLDVENFYLIKAQGKLENLRTKVDPNVVKGAVAIGHTRWATHGKPDEKNAHPHRSGSTFIVHNGIIENHLELKRKLESEGAIFATDTDSEVIAHLVEGFLVVGFDMITAVKKTVDKLEGAYAIAVVSLREPDKIVVARNFSPLIVGVGQGEKFVSSEAVAILPYCSDMIFLEDGDIASISKTDLQIFDKDGKRVSREAKSIYWDQTATQKSGYKHFMLKEIYEQPQAVLDTLRGKFSYNESEVILDDLDSDIFKGVEHVYLLGCGTSYHASIIGKYLFESIGGIRSCSELASEFRYRDPVISDKTLVIGLSQSGETADTSEALREAKRRGARVVGITNVQMSKISLESDGVVYTRAGPEIGVASTKAFTSQLTVLLIMSVYLADFYKKIDTKRVKDFIKKIVSIPKLLQMVLSVDDVVKDVAKQFYGYKNFLFLGRGINYPIALEGALKLKEISYIHAEGYAAGEMKHGPIALVDENMPVVIIAPKDELYFKKMIGNFQEIKARGGRIILITSGNGMADLLDDEDSVIHIPFCDDILTPFVTVVPVQFLAYHIASLLGTDIDQPRNLAKVVTVE